MDRSTLGFWALVLALFGAAGYFAVGVLDLHAQARTQEVSLASGDVVSLHSVVDGDTLVVAKPDAGLATVRLLGIKSFETKRGKDEGAAHGRAAEEGLRRLAAGQPLRVLLNNPPKDRHGRTLATLYVGGDDIGLALVARGHALAYTVYPFVQMPVYLQAQKDARAQQLGLWSDPGVVARADALLREWARATP